jgi:hypothetical protein
MQRKSYSNSLHPCLLLGFYFYSQERVAGKNNVSFSGSAENFV